MSNLAKGADERRPAYAQRASMITIGALALILLAFGAGPVTAQEGNNGTVNIHEGGGEPTPLERNEPKVCEFHVHGFNFDASQSLTVAIVGHGGPNAGPSSYQNAVTADASGGFRDPASGAIQLDDGMYKLTVETGQGAGKHKVFKVDCAAAAAAAEGAAAQPANEDEGTNLPNTATALTGADLLLPAAALGVVLLALAVFLIARPRWKGRVNA